MNQEKDIRTIIRENIDAELSQRGWSQQQLSDFLGVGSGQTIGKYKNGIVPGGEFLLIWRLKLGYHLYEPKGSGGDSAVVSSNSIHEVLIQNQAILMTILSAVSELISEQTGEDRILLAARLNKVLGGYLTKVKQGDILEQIGIGGKES